MDRNTRQDVQGHAIDLARTAADCQVLAAEIADYITDFRVDYVGRVQAASPLEALILAVLAHRAGIGDTDPDRGLPLLDFVHVPAIQTGGRRSGNRRDFELKLLRPPSGPGSVVVAQVPDGSRVHAFADGHEFDYTLELVCPAAAAGILGRAEVRRREELEPVAGTPRYVVEFDRADPTWDTTDTRDPEDVAVAQKALEVPQDVVEDLKYKAPE